MGAWCSHPREARVGSIMMFVSRGIWGNSWSKPPFQRPGCPQGDFLQRYHSGPLAASRHDDSFGGDGGGVARALCGLVPGGRTHHGTVDYLSRRPMLEHHADGSRTSREGISTRGRVRVWHGSPVRNEARGARGGGKRLDPLALISWLARQPRSNFTGPYRPRYGYGAG
jgi:hypothetical protein